MQLNTLNVLNATLELVKHMPLIFLTSDTSHEQSIQAPGISEQYGKSW